MDSSYNVHGSFVSSIVGRVCWPVETPPQTVELVPTKCKFISILVGVATIILEFTITHTHFLVRGSFLHNDKQRFFSSDGQVGGLYLHLDFTYRCGTNQQIKGFSSCLYGIFSTGLIHF